MSKKISLIKQDFLQKENIKNTQLKSSLLTNNYIQMCQIFKQHYQYLKQNIVHSLTYNLKYQKKQQYDYAFINEFKNYLKQFISIIQQVATYQVACFQNLKDVNLKELITANFYKQIKDYNIEYTRLFNLQQQFILNIEQLKKYYLKYKQEIKSIIKYYNQDFIMKQKKYIYQKISKSQQIIKYIFQRINKQQQIITYIEPQIILFRKNLLKNKYKIHKKILQLVQNTKNALIEMSQTLKSFSKQGKQKFLNIIANKQDDILYLKNYMKERISQNYIEHHSNQNKIWQNLLKKSATQYLKQCQMIQRLFLNLIKIFQDKARHIPVVISKLRQNSEKLKPFFEQQQSPVFYILDLINLVQCFYKKICKIIYGLEDIYKKTLFSKNECNKNVEVALSLLKVKRKSNQGLLDSTKNNKNNYIIQLINSISFSSVKNNLLQFYDICILGQEQLIKSTIYSQPQRRKTLDSMQISHFNGRLSEKIMNKKIPIKQQRWLWRQIKIQKQLNFLNELDYFNHIKQSFQSIQQMFTIQKSQQLGQFNGCLRGSSDEKIIGNLKLNKNCFEFVSSLQNLKIPWKQILKIQQQKQFFNQYIVLTTTKGKLKLYELQNYTKILQLLKDTLQNSNIGKTNILKRQKVHINQQQLKYIEERYRNIKQNIPNVQEYKLILQQTYPEQQIDQFYQFFYSDKPFNFYGKQQPCFFSYTAKKAGNYDWVAQKYDKQGPQFYSLNKNINFKNCPLFSTRIITFKHPMKTTGIPFMPKFCTNKDIRKMYWISNKELLYFFQCFTQGVPLCDTFVVQMIHKITQQGNNIKVQFYSKIKFVKDTFMKDTIIKNTDPQIDENMKVFAKQIQKVLKLKKQMKTGQITNIPIEQIKQITNNPQKQEVNKLKLHNKILIIGILLLFLIQMINILS